MNPAPLPRPSAASCSPAPPAPWAAAAPAPAPALHAAAGERRRRHGRRATAGEEVVQAALEDRAAVHALLEGIDAVVHLGGISTEQPFEPILQANIVGVYNLYEAARQHGVKRIVFASSNHVTGFYRQDEVIDATMPVRPDGYYGVSKAFGENLSRFYFDRYGIETVCLRIGSSFPEPKDRRMLATWLSYDDLERLVRRQPDRARRRPQHRLRHVRQRHDLVGQHAGRATSASARRTARSLSAPRARRAQPTLDLQDPAVLLPGRRLRAHGPVRITRPQGTREPQGDKHAETTSHHPASPRPPPWPAQPGPPPRKAPSR